MTLLVYIIVLIFEIIYYTLFMKYSKNDNKLWKYLIVFSIVNVILFFIGSLNLFAYIIFMILSLIGLKIIGKTSLYDMFVIFVMLLFKLFIELIGAFTLPIVIHNIDVCKTILGVVKIVIVVLLHNKLHLFYNKFKEYWNNNNFYIRYIFSILMFVYIIAACLFLIKYQ